MMVKGCAVHMENGPVGRALFSFAVPVLLSQLLQELYNVTDCLIVGRFGGDYALAAAALGGLVLSVMINFFVGFSSGVSVVTARTFGSYDYRALQETMTAVFRLVLTVGLAISVLGAAGTGTILRLLKSPAEVMPRATVYFRLCACGLMAQLFYNVGTAVLRSLGDTKTPLLLFGLSALCNLALDVLFVIGFRWGIAGAAGATLLSQWLLAVLIFRHLRRLDSAYALTLTGPRIPRKELRAILRMGLPAGMQALFMSISSLLIQRYINGFGPDAMAGMNLYAKVEGCLYLPTFAYGIALTSFVGQNLGAGKLDRIREAVKLSIRTMCACVLPLSLLLVWVSPVILKLFTPETGILFNAREAILFNLPFYTVYAVNQIYLGAIKGLGDTAWPMTCTLLCYSLFRVIWCRALIPVFASMRVVYLSYDVSFFLMLLLLLPRYRALFRQKRRTLSTAYNEA